MKKNISIHKNFRILFSLALIVGGTLGINAQLHEQINVDGKYVPDIVYADRLHVLPHISVPAIKGVALEFEEEGVSADFGNSLYTMSASGWRARKDFQTSRGYLRVGAGSWLNAVASAGYRLIDSPSSLLGVRLQHNSTSLWKAPAGTGEISDKQYRYDEELGVYFNHIFKGIGRIDASLDYHLGLFNYYGVTLPENSSLNAPKQTLNDISVLLGWKPMIRPQATWKYSAEIGVKYFGLKSMAMPLFADSYCSKADRETDIYLAGNLTFPWGKHSGFSLDASLDIIAYGGRKDNLDFLFPASNIKYEVMRPENYGMFTLTPAYTWKNDVASLNFGLDIDLTANAGIPGGKYSFVHIAPDVKIATKKGKIGAWLNITGGSNLNTLSALRQYDYYQMPLVTSTRPTYMPLDASLGVSLGSFSGFSAKIEFCYKVSKGTPLGGWYTTWLQMGSLPLKDSMLPAGSRASNLLYSLDADGLDMHGLSLGMNLEYVPAAWLGIQADLHFQPQKGKTGYFNGYDRPKVTADVEVSGHPISPLQLSLGFNYRGGRKIYTRTFYTENEGGMNIINVVKSELTGLSLPDLSLLNFKASWSFTKDISVWLHADNILNRHTWILPMQPTQGIVITAGCDWIF